MFPQMPHRVTNIRRLLTALLLLAVTAGVLLPAVPSRAQGPRLVLAFYYTWFDENTWTPAKVPDFPAQTYVSRDPASMDRHIAQAQSAGIDALVVSWYGPWNNQTETNFAAMLDVANARGFKLALDVEVTSPFVWRTARLKCCAMPCLSMPTTRPICASTASQCCSSGANSASARAHGNRFAIRSTPATPASGSPRAST